MRMGPKKWVLTHDEVGKPEIPCYNFVDMIVNMNA